MVKFNRGIQVSWNPSPCYIQSGWDTACENPLQIWCCSGNVYRGFAAVKFIRGIEVKWNPAPCDIQSGLDAVCKNPL